MDADESNKYGELYCPSPGNGFAPMPRHNCRKESKRCDSRELIHGAGNCFQVPLVLESDTGHGVRECRGSCHAPRCIVLARSGDRGDD